MKTNDTTLATGAEHPIQEVMGRYLSVLKQIDICKQELTIIVENACSISGVNKRPFKAIAKALHEAEGEIETKLESIESFINVAFGQKGIEFKWNETEETKNRNQS